MESTRGKTPFRTADLGYMALGAVLIAVCSWISVPATVPFTMQTFAVCFVLSALGGKRGTMAILVYLLLGAAGIPVFAQFKSGLANLLGSTGGYLAGFVFMGLLYWLVTRLLGKKLWTEILALVLGLAALYAFGTAWFLLVYTKTNEAMGLMSVLGLCVLPFILPDLVKLGLAVTLARRVSRALNGTRSRAD